MFNFFFFSNVTKNLLNRLDLVFSVCIIMCLFPLGLHLGQVTCVAFGVGSVCYVISHSINSTAIFKCIMRLYIFIRIWTCFKGIVYTTQKRFWKFFKRQVWHYVI